MTHFCFLILQRHIDKSFSSNRANNAERLIFKRGPKKVQERNNQIVSKDDQQSKKDTKEEKRNVQIVSLQRLPALPARCFHCGGKIRRLISQTITATRYCCCGSSTLQCQLLLFICTWYLVVGTCDNHSWYCCGSSTLHCQLLLYLCTWYLVVGTCDNHS